MPSYESETIDVYKCIECGSEHCVADEGERQCMNCSGMAGPVRPATGDDFMNSHSCRPSMYEGDIVDKIDDIAAAYVVWLNDGGALRHATTEVAGKLASLGVEDEFHEGIVEHAIRAHFNHIDPP